MEFRNTGVVRLRTLFHDEKSGSRRSLESFGLHSASMIIELFEKVILRQELPLPVFPGI